MFQFQSNLIFPTHAVPPAGPLRPGATRLSVDTPGGDRLVGIHIPPDSPQSEPNLILGFGGNAWNAQDVAEYVHELFPDDDVITFHYRGYAPSTGQPSAEALIADAPLIYYLARTIVRAERVVAVGFSIGSGIAAQLSAKRELDGLILVTPFDSLKKVAQSLFPWAPIGPFFEHEIDTVAGLKGGKVPVAILAGDRDEIVPPARTAVLRENIPNIVFDRTISGAGHNDIYARSDFQLAMRDALKTLLGH